MKQMYSRFRTWYYFNADFLMYVLISILVLVCFLGLGFLLDYYYGDVIRGNEYFSMGQIALWSSVTFYYIIQLSTRWKKENILGRMILVYLSGLSLIILNAAMQNHQLIHILGSNL